MFHSWPALDLDLLLIINRRLECGILTSLMRFMTDKANWLPLLVLFALFLVWWGRVEGPFLGRLFSVRRGRNGRLVLLVILLSVSLSDFGSNALKHSVARQRPCRDPDVELLVEERFHVHGNRSFPSSHAANSAAIATVIVLSLGSPAGPVAMLFAFLVGFSRVYLGVHYPLDVAAGWIVGLSSGMLFWAWFRRGIGRAGLLDFTAVFRRGAQLPHEHPGAAWECLSFETTDGHVVDGFLRRGSGDELAVIVHGLGSSCFMYTPVCSFFMDLGFSVLLVPLRGHNWHPVRRCTGGVDECNDLMGALDDARQAGWSPEVTLVYGCSMGAVTALRSAALMGAHGDRADGLMGIIAHSPFTSFADSARRKLGELRSRVFMSSIPSAVRAGLSDLDIGLYCSLLPADCPVIYLLGDRDMLTPLEDIWLIREATPVSSVLLLSGAGHPRWVYGDEMSVQERVAMGECVRRFRRGEAGEAALVDVFGYLSDDTGSITN